MEIWFLFVGRDEFALDEGIVIIQRQRPFVNTPDIEVDLLTFEYFALDGPEKATVPTRRGGLTNDIRTFLE